MPNPEGIATGTELNRDDAVCRALRFLLLQEAERLREKNVGSYWLLEARDRKMAEAMSLYEELGGVTIDE